MRTTALTLFVFFALSLTCSGAIIFTTDFESGAPPEVLGAGGLVSVAGFPAPVGLGSLAWQNDLDGNPALATVISLTGLGPHTWLRVNFDFIAFDSWDGLDPTYGPDYLNLSIGASNLYFSVTNFPANIEDGGVSGPYNFGTLGRAFSDGTSYGGNPDWADSVWRMGFDIPHTASTAVLSFYASGAGWQGFSDESFGLDNIVVETDAIPEPTSLLLLGTGLGVIGLAAWRRRK